MDRSSERSRKDHPVPYAFRLGCRRPDSLNAPLYRHHRKSVIDRECFLDGRRHTLILENKSPKCVLAFSHDDLQKVQISYKAWGNMKKTLSPD